MRSLSRWRMNLAIGRDETKSYVGYAQLLKTLCLAGKPLDPKNEPTAFVYTATADYFKTMSIPVLAGRVFTAQDTASAPTVVVIDQIMADRYYPGENPIG